MKHDPVAYSKPEGESVGCFFMTMSPDGWVNAFYQPEMGRGLTPEERLEFIGLTNAFMRMIRDASCLKAYVRKHGTVTMPGAVPVYGIMYSGDLLAYHLRITGMNVEFTPYRKDVA